jgi:hypothetical protein
MANRYGEAAIMVARQGGSNPADSWEKAMAKLYPTSPMARKKGGPRSAFLGLCEEGLVKGIPAGHYAKSSARENKSYAVKAVALLLEGTQRWSSSALWQAVTEDTELQQNHQMDVVLALWNNDLIVGKPEAPAAV